MERDEAFKRLLAIKGKDLRTLADEYGVPVFKDGNRKNKGWAGQVLERHLGLPLNSSRSPNFGSWELKLISLKYLKKGNLTVKETMQITMLDPINVEQVDFEDSHLLIKLKRLIVAARIWESQQEQRSLLYGVRTFDLDNPELYDLIKADYQEIGDYSTALEHLNQALKLYNTDQDRTRDSILSAYRVKKHIEQIHKGNPILGPLSDGSVSDLPERPPNSR